MNAPTFIDVAIALVLVAIAIAVSRFWKIPVQKEMSIGAVRAFIQLVAVGYALKYIFALESLWLIVLALLVMLTVGAYTAAGRVKQIERPFVISFIAMTLGSFITLGIMLATGLITLEARFVIPLGGMLISNSMNASTLTSKSITTAMKENRLAIEAALALGKSWREASKRFQREAATQGLVSILNFMKTVGIVALPGAMTGMILGGAEPLEAVLLQLIVGYMLLSAVTITTVITLELVVRQFFTEQDQFRAKPLA